MKEETERREYRMSGRERNLRSVFSVTRAVIIKDSDKVVSWMGWDMRGRGDERSRRY